MNDATGDADAIVKEQVETRGGRVWIDPEVTASATIRFTWSERTK